jgi:Glycosyl transferases group 1
MRLAFITSLLPTGTPDTGFEIANACILEALAATNCEVKVFGFTRLDDPQLTTRNTIVLEKIAIENAVASKAQKAKWLAQSLLRKLPVISTKLALFGETQLQEALLAHGPFDAYIINSAPVAGAFPSLLDKPCILIAHNVEHVSAQENAMSSHGLTALLYRREARLLKAIELQTLAKAQFVWCFAEEDRKGFGVDISHKSAVMPLLMPARSSLPETAAVYDIGLIGTWTWQPNLVGLQWFVDKVVPFLPSEMSIGIAGRLPKDFRSGAANVGLLGRVPDAAEFVASCRAIALTSRNGTGIQLKTIETFQMGKPTVATKSSIRGLGKLPTNCLVADDPANFAAALIKMVKDIKSERTQPGDGSAFIASQRAGIASALQQGFDALKRKRA